jgi:hypothetical protein
MNTFNKPHTFRGFVTVLQMVSGIPEVDRKTHRQITVGKSG